MIVRRRSTTPAARAAAPGHIGLRHDGSLFRSETPVDNAATNFTRWLVAEIRSQYLSPAATVERIGAQHEAVRRMLTLATAGAWAVLDRFHDWPLAHGYNSFEETVRSLGGAYPWMERDQRVWCDMIRAAADRHRYRLDVVRVALPGRPRTDYSIAPGVGIADVMHAVLSGRGVEGILEDVDDQTRW